MQFVMYGFSLFRWRRAAGRRWALAAPAMLVGLVGAVAGAIAKHAAVCADWCSVANEK